MIDMTRLEEKADKPSRKKHDLTVNDIKDGALARDLVVFFLLDDLAKESHQSLDQLTEQLSVVFSIFSAVVMLPYVATGCRKLLGAQLLLHGMELTYFRGLKSLRAVRTIMCNVWTLGKAISNQGMVRLILPTLP